MSLRTATGRAAAVVALTSVPLAGPAVAAPTPPPTPAAKPAPQTGGIGARSGLPFDSGVFAHSPDRVARYEQKTGRKVDVWQIAPQRNEGTAGLLSETQRTVGEVPAGATVDLAIPLVDQAVGQQIGSTLNAKTPTAYVRPGWEMNLEGSWPWTVGNIGAEQYRQQFRATAAGIRSSCPKCRITWNPNSGQGGVEKIQAAYPGDDVVDVVGVDVYDWKNEDAINGKGGLNEWAAFAKAHGKKLSLPEWGVHGGGDGKGDNPAYVQSILAFIKANRGLVTMASYFDEPAAYIKNSVGDGQMPKTGEALRAGFAALGNGGGGAIPAPVNPGNAAAPPAQGSGQQAPQGNPGSGQQQQPNVPMPPVPSFGPVPRVEANQGASGWLRGLLGRDELSGDGGGWSLVRPSTWFDWAGPKGGSGEEPQSAPPPPQQEAAPQQEAPTPVQVPTPTQSPAPSGTAPKDQRRASFTDKAGTRSTYHLFGSKVQGTVRGLVVFLDGDGQNGHDNPDSAYALGGPQGVVAQAGAKGYAVLSIRTPDSGSKTWWRDGSRNAAYAADLIQKVKGETGAGQVTALGFSGGSQLITKYLIPAHPGLLTQAVVTGGGGPPEGDPPKTGTRVHWHTGAADTAADYDAISDAKRGAAAYQKSGAQVSTSWPAGVTHDLSGQFGRIIAAQLR